MNAERAASEGGPALLERSASGLATLTLDSPPLNLFDWPMIESVSAAIEDLRLDPPRAILVRGAGRVVSGGLDVSILSGLSVEQGAKLWSTLLAAVTTLERIPAPAVFAAHGLTLTAAFELALGCDVIVASPEARFGLVEKVVGVTPSMGGAQRLAERAGSGRARDLILSGELFDAETMRQWGVVNRIFAAERFAENASGFAEELAAGPTRAHAMTKLILRRFREGGVPAADEAVRTHAGELFASEDAIAAIATFRERGGPGHATFRGR